MANPFLFMEEETGAENPVADSYSNPFLVEDDDEVDEFSAENPFSASNPFAFNDADDNANEKNNVEAESGASLFIVENDIDEQQVDATMSFFGTTINEYDGLQYQKPNDLIITQHEMADDVVKHSEDDAVHSHKPPPRPLPPSQMTQQLITNLTDHLDQTSTNLLGKLPKTRTPSPISMRDLHSPDVGDLLDVSDMLSCEQEQQSNNVVPKSNDHEVEHKPHRPPPPRPVPPRPTPPKGSLKSSPVTEPPPIITNNSAKDPQAHQQDDDDLLNFFGSEKKKPPKPAPPKSNKDILSLFTAPTQPVVADQKPDLLSEDMENIDFTVQNHTQAAVAIVQPYEPEKEIVIEVQEEKVIPQQPIVEEPLIQKEEFVENHIASSDSMTKMEISPDHSIKLNNHEQEKEVEEVEQPKSEVPSNHHSPEIEKVTTSTSSGYLSNTTLQESETPEITQIQVTQAEDEPSPKLQFLQQRSEVYQNQRPTTPDPIVALPELAPIFGGQITTSPAKAAPPPPPARDGSVLSSVKTQQPAVVPEIVKPDEFDDFSMKFESKGQTKATGNAFLDSLETTAVDTADAWGGSDAFDGNNVVDDGFGNEDGFDSWDAPVVPESTPFMNRRSSIDSDEGKDFSVVIKPKAIGFDLNDHGSVAPILGPPPPQRSPYSGSVYSGDSSPRVNPFESSYTEPQMDSKSPERRDSQDSGPGTPLFDDDVSQPLEDFPRIFYEGPGWEMQLRQPNKKKITGQRFWKKVFVRMVWQGDNPVVQLLNKDTDKEPFQELPLQGCYSISEIAAQQFDNFGKIFTIKLQYVFYKERPGVRPGQVTKAERITTKLSMFAKYAIEGDYQGVKEFGSDLKKLGLPVEHAPQMSQLFKLGSMNYEDLKQFSMCIEEALFKLNVHRDRALTYKMEEVQVTAVDEIYVEQSSEGYIEKQIARVRLFFLGFLSGMPDIELGLNDLWRQGKEVVGRHDIIPVATEEWIRLEGVEFHSCVQQDQYERTRTIKFKPPDACYIELMRFRVRPPKNRELPLQLKATWVVTGNKVQLRADVLVPGFTSRKLGQIPCEDVAIRFPIPECWIYLFRVEKHFRYGSVKSTHRRTGKIKGIERFLGTVETLQESLIEVTSGQAKYEHHHRAIVWRCPRLPKEGQGAYTTHQLICRLALTSFDQIPDQLAPYAYIEFTMPATQVSHTTVRSVSVQESDSDEPPEKYVRYLARHEYRVGIEHTMGESQNAYLSATAVKTPQHQPIREEPVAATPMATHSDTDSDSN
ncbi:CLUMA_CG004801, isoform A [Clunio marinus]|uniref:CLUMA_CG004801, isoform A n=1 Tax=Clunio marinus TaxID=568069 RepID=A0A1J1HYA0_9DIPT|nr:CLUMA_CG004801, isoform A [Clunio marinus]